MPFISLLAALLMRPLPKTGVDAQAHEDLRPCPARNKTIAGPITLKERSGWILRFPCASQKGGLAWRSIKR
ncbi:hypothetical protein GV819_16875 [Pseudomonas sp. Fl5BN2]|uniref:hypothetical protein n=1 Tax=Pseudomonas sp. Fl5BN2 TaxID=2697652 RepID=UPI001376979B|nr:hypothetical protein [Pseudomonas sp. Fl5BN2]NBF03969.1 hypothetical protein [Pseudomonas sp. Fl5BN2]